MSTTGKKVGIMGGTFDPPHLAHIIPVEIAAAEFQLDYVWFVPALVPPHKLDQRRTDPFHRTAMLALALKNFPHFRISPLELLRGDVSFTINTIQELRSSMAPEDRLFFIMGSDSFLEMRTWYQPAKLLASCEFIVLNRGIGQDELLENLQRLENEFQMQLANTVHFSSSPSLPYSSTEIRRLAHEHGDISGMIFGEVEAYINKHSLYRR